MNIDISTANTTFSLCGCFEVTQNKFSITITDCLPNLMNLTDEFKIAIKYCDSDKMTNLYLGQYSFDGLKFYQEKRGIISENYYTYTFIKQK